MLHVLGFESFCCIHSAPLLESPLHALVYSFIFLNKNSISYGKKMSNDMPTSYLDEINKSKFSYCSESLQSS